MHSNLDNFMKRTILTLILVGASALLCGCSQARARASVMMKFPDGDVASVPDSSYEFIIRQPDGSVWYAYCDGVPNSPTPIV